MSIESVMPSNHLIPFSPLQSFPASGSFQMSQFFASGGQSTGVSASTSVLPMNTQDWLDLLAVQGTLKNLLQYHTLKASILWCSPFFIVQLSRPYMTTEKNSLDKTDLCWQSNVSAFPLLQGINSHVEPSYLQLEEQRVKNSFSRKFERKTIFKGG